MRSTAGRGRSRLAPGRTGVGSGNATGLSRTWRGSTRAPGARRGGRDDLVERISTVIGNGPASRARTTRPGGSVLRDRTPGYRPRPERSGRRPGTAAQAPTPRPRPADRRVVNPGLSLTLHGPRPAPPGARPRRAPPDDVARMRPANAAIEQKAVKRTGHPVISLTIETERRSIDRRRPVTGTLPSVRISRNRRRQGFRSAREMIGLESIATVKPELPNMTFSWVFFPPDVNRRNDPLAILKLLCCLILIRVEIQVPLAGAWRSRL